MNEVRKISDSLIGEMREAIDGADKVLVGIGMEWMASVETRDVMSEAIIREREYYKSLYTKLKSLLCDKDYYIMTLCYDDLVYDVFEEERVVAPCGGYRLLQCGQHVMTKDEVSMLDGEPRCPLCNRPLTFNNIESDMYMEEGYMDRFADYKQWLQSTINRKLVILELGADLKYPSVIRFSFDRLCQYNLKSKFYRVNKSLYQHSAESGERGISVQADSRELIASFFD